MPCAAVADRALGALVLGAVSLLAPCAAAPDAAATVMTPAVINESMCRMPNFFGVN
jgi:hypothetical protein